MIKYSAEIYDFELSIGDEDTSWIKLQPEESFDLLAREGGGGVFVSYGSFELEERPVLFASSEGQAGKIANNLTELISTFVEIPYWYDLLKFSDGGSLSEMRKSAVYLEAEYNEDNPDLQEYKKIISNKLGLDLFSDPIAQLHSCVGDTSCTLVSPDGWKYESLFGQFKTTDNKFWS